MRTVFVFLGILFGLTVSSALAQHNAVGQAYVTELTAVADALESVHDDASAAEAAEAMGAAIERMEPLAEEIKGWSNAEKQSFYFTFGEDVMAQHERIGKGLEAMLNQPERFEAFYRRIKEMPRIN